MNVVHVAIERGNGTNSLLEIAAFRAFQENIAARCDEPPQPVALREIGSYHVNG